MPLELLKSKTGRTLIESHHANHVILSEAKNLCHGGRDSSVAIAPSE